MISEQQKVDDKHWSLSAIVQAWMVVMSLESTVLTSTVLSKVILQ